MEAHHIHDSAPISIHKLISHHSLLPAWVTPLSNACGHQHSQAAFCFLIIYFCPPEILPPPLRMSAKFYRNTHPVWYSVSLMDICLRHCPLHLVLDLTMCFSLLDSLLVGVQELYIYYQSTQQLSYCFINTFCKPALTER